MRVLLITMPFCTTRWPSMGISLLKSELRQAGIPTDIRYLNLDFARMVGAELFEDLCLFPPNLMGERIFARAVFPEGLPGDEAYVDYLNSAYHGPRDFVPKAMRLQRHVNRYLDHCLASVRWQDYDVVGFTSMFEQNLASVALAQRLKETNPEIVVAFGGANCEAEMGLELHRAFPCIDYVCRGEADLVFPELVRRLSRDEPIDGLPGLVYRRNGESLEVDRCGLVGDLDILPTPDYEDYFEQLRDSGLPPSSCEEIHLETSRGCWWGSKCQCKFCGLNGSTIGFRSKSEERVLEEIEELVDRYILPHRIPRISVVDNILDMRYFKRLLPELKERKLPVRIFYEVKANLNQQQVKLLREAGIHWVQPGIESLSDHVLRLMSKGVTAVQNIQLLKSCRRFGVYPTWNLIHGFPGETADDYEQMVKLMYSLVHLDPPEGLPQMSLQRFSPYFIDSERHGIVNVRPEPSYSFVYPFDEERLANLAYFFDFDYRDTAGRPRDYSALTRAVEYWVQCKANNAFLRAVEISEASLVIEDGRCGPMPSKTLLRDDQKAVYQFCDSARRLPGIVSHLQQTYPGCELDEGDVLAFLEDLVARDLMVVVGDYYLSLAVPVERRPRPELAIPRLASTAPTHAWQAGPA